MCYSCREAVDTRMRLLCQADIIFEIFKFLSTQNCRSGPSKKAAKDTNQECTQKVYLMSLREMNWICFGVCFGRIHQRFLLWCIRSKQTPKAKIGLQPIENGLHL